MRRSPPNQMHAHRAQVPVTLVLIALLLAGGGRVQTLARAVERSVTVQPPAGRSVAAGDSQVGYPDAPSRTALVRASAPAIARLQAPGASSSDVGRAAVARASGTANWTTSPREPGVTVEARAHGLRAPGQPAPSSRAPPLV
jgi:hypothetical protein